MELQDPCSQAPSAAFKGPSLHTQLAFARVSHPLEGMFCTWHAVAHGGQSFEFVTSLPETAAAAAAVADAIAVVTAEAERVPLE